MNVSQPGEGSASGTGGVGPALIDIEDLSLWQDARLVLDDIRLQIPRTGVLALIGPPDSGATALMKALGRMLDGTPGVRTSGRIRMTGQDIRAPGIVASDHRRRFGWIAGAPGACLETIFEHIAYWGRVHGPPMQRAALAAHVEACLRRAGLRDEVGVGLHSRIVGDLDAVARLRLSVARALSARPEVLLVDRCGPGPDPEDDAILDELLADLKADHAIVMACDRPGPAQRSADRVAFLDAGRLLETGAAKPFLDHPQSDAARRFLAGI